MGCEERLETERTGENPDISLNQHRELGVGTADKGIRED